MTAVAMFVLDRGYRWLLIAATGAVLFIAFTLWTAHKDRNRHNQERKP